jgi:hypothetical protein
MTRSIRLTALAIVLLVATGGLVSHAGAAPAVAVTSSISLSSSAAHPGGSVDVRGAGCSTNVNFTVGVEIALLDAGNQIVSTAFVGHDGIVSGAWSATLPVPVGTPSGAYSVSAACDQYEASFNYSPAALVVDSIAPTARLTSPRALVATSTRVVVAYVGADTGSGVINYDLSVRTAAWNRSFTAYRALATARTLRSLVVTGKPGTQYCFRVRARDRAGNVSVWSAAACIAVPLDDRALTATSRSWTSSVSTSSFLRTIKSAHRLGASLRLSGAKGDRVAVVVTDCPGCGSVSVFINGSRVKTIATASSRVRYRVVAVTSRTAVKAMVVTLRTTSSRRVLVDGLAIIHT